MTEQEIRDLFKRLDVPLDRDDVWSVQAARVVKHKALERLAAALNIAYDPPQILRAERDEAVILVTGKLPGGGIGSGQSPRSEWSIGEALATDGSRPGNYKVSGKQAPYVYAMAEKRAKDRVILKLAGLHGAYSEDEADDFKQPRQEAVSKVEVDNTSDRTLSNALIAALDKAESQADLGKWFTDNRATVEGLPEDLRDAVRSAYAGRLHTLKRAA